jgi:hypothetical protein
LSWPRHPESALQGRDINTSGLTLVRTGFAEKENVPMMAKVHIAIAVRVDVAKIVSAVLAFIITLLF